jgi:hypothetical protein
MAHALANLAFGVSPNTGDDAKIGTVIGSLVAIGWPPSSCGRGSGATASAGSALSAIVPPTRCSAGTATGRIRGGRGECGVETWSNGTPIAGGT